MKTNYKSTIEGVRTGAARAEIQFSLARAQGNLAKFEQQIKTLPDRVATQEARDAVVAVMSGRVEHDVAVGKLPSDELQAAAERALGELSALERVRGLSEHQVESNQQELKLIGDLEPLVKNHPWLAKQTARLLDSLLHA